MNAHVPVVDLNDGKEIPLLGLGTYRLRGDDAIRLIREAIDLGYRHFDTATLYENEEELGKAFAQAIAAGDVTREELFVTTKVWHDYHGADKLPEAFHGSLKRLGFDFIDLYMVHWPFPAGDKYVETFEAMAQLQGHGLIQCVGTANFKEHHLTRIIDETGVVPAVNQVECHVGFTQAPLREFHAKHKIVTEAWSPLGKGTVLTDPDIKAIGAKRDKSNPQIALRFLTQLGVAVIPKSSTPERLKENLDIFGFRLKRDEMDALLVKDDADGAGRLGADPDHYPEV